MGFELGRVPWPRAEHPAPAELPVAHDLWPGVLCRGNDAHGRAPL